MLTDPDTTSERIMNRIERHRYKIAHIFLDEVLTKDKFCNVID